MDHLFLTPESIPMLAKSLLAVSVTGYLIFFAEKDKTIKWFVAYLLGYCMLDLFALMGEIFQTEWAFLGLPLQYLASIVFTFCYLQFAYLFKEEHFKTEHRRVTLITGFFAVLSILFTFYQIYEVGLGEYTMIQALLPFPLLLIIWSAVVFYRKYRIAKQKEDAQGTLSPAYRSFFVVTVLAIVISLTPALRALGFIGHAFFTISFFILNLVVFCMLTANAMNYLINRTTVLVKLVGISLALFVSVIGLQGFMVVPDYEYQNDQVVTTEERQSTHNKVIPYVWFLFGSVTVILTLFPVFYSRSVLLPLRRLLEGVDKVNKGNLDTEIPILNEDEFGVVSNHFNEMTKNLKTANLELQEYAESLETRVTERTQELHAKTEELERMDQFRTKLFTDISHELRTPITLMSGPLQHLSSNSEIDRGSHEQVQMALRNSERLKKLVEQIIDLNKLESDKLVLHISKVDVTVHLSHIIQSFESLLEYNNLRFDISIPAKSIELYLDIDKFEKIINNLISNAVKFTPDRGLISVKVEEQELDVCITVSDTGIGIKPDKVATVFDRYQSSAYEDADYKEGLGVGLAITKEYVTLHEGSISVESMEGKGSSFVVRFKKGKEHLADYSESDTVSEFPAQENPKVEQAGKEKIGTAEVTKGPSILIVEDNSDMADYMSTILASEGYRTTHAQNGKIALDQLESFHPDLIISDIMMPVMDGMEFLEELRNNQSFSDIPTIFLSARSDMEGKLQSFRLGVNDYLVKPFNTTELLCRIENLISYYKTRKQAQIELSDEASESLDQELVNKVTQLIEERIEVSNLTIDDLAGDLAMSRRTLYRELKRATGMSAAAFVREVRLQKARQKLESGLVRSVNEVSGSVGFQTDSYFSKMYYKRFGKKPIEYFR